MIHQTLPTHECYQYLAIKDTAIATPSAPTINALSLTQAHCPSLEVLPNVLDITNPNTRHPQDPQDRSIAALDNDMTERFTFFQVRDGNNAEIDAKTHSAATNSSRLRLQDYDNRESIMDIPNSNSTSTTRPPFVKNRDGSRWLPRPLSTSYISRRERRDQPRIEHGPMRSTPRSDIVESTYGPPPSPIQQRNRRHSQAVHNVLKTNELLEMILLNLSTDEILAVRRVSKVWESTVRLPRLGWHLFIKPQWNRPIAQTKVLCLDHITGVQCWMDNGYANSPFYTVSVAMTLQGCDEILSGNEMHIGKHAYVSQPPTTGVHGRILAATDPDLHEESLDLTDAKTICIMCEHGVTLHHLAKAAAIVFGRAHESGADMRIQFEYYACLHKPADGPEIPLGSYMVMNRPGLPKIVDLEKHDHRPHA